MENSSTIVQETIGAVARITLNRTQQLNALNEELMDALVKALLAHDADPTIRAIIITGSDKAFAAGVDIKGMATLDFESAYTSNLITRNWAVIDTIRTPIIAAVAGYALGGGCELALACDTIIAADNAQFGQPEIKLGIIPGAGGTQRLTRAVGKAKAMDLILTGRMMGATEAEQSGIVARIVPLAELNEAALKMAQTIANYGAVSVMMAKESVNAAFETTLSAGLQYERRSFHATFATTEQSEGMAAFIEKRAAVFNVTKPE